MVQTKVKNKTKRKKKVTKAKKLSKEEVSVRENKENHVEDVKNFCFSSIFLFNKGKAGK